MYWQGVRYGTELPINYTGIKNLAPETINHDYMWTEKYVPYADWESKLKKIYDNFNLLQIPPV